MWDLFLTFCKIGAFTFGGGYAMLPMIKREVVDNRHWATEEEIADYFAVGQCTPGVIAVNTATFIGCKLRGALGGAVATLGVIAPSFLIIVILAAFINAFAEYKIVKDAFWGIRAAVAALIVSSFISLIKSNIKSISGIVIFVAAFVLSMFFGVPVTLIVVLAAISGIIIKIIGRKKT